MATMTAFRLVGWREPPEFAEVPVPTPGPGEVPVKKTVPKLSAGSTALVIGVGGLGGFAVQYLRLLTAARVVAVDLVEHRLERARALGADETLSFDCDVAAHLSEITAGAGADAVF